MLLKNNRTESEWEMEIILEVARKNNFDLNEISILIELDKEYPRAVPMEKISNNGQIEGSVNNLITKGFIEIRWNKCRMKK